MAGKKKKLKNKKKICQCNPLCKQTQRKKSHMIISLDADKAFDIIQYPFILKFLERSGIQGPYLNTVKPIYCKPVFDSKLNGEKLEAIPVKSGTRQDCPLSSYLFNVVLDVLVRAIRLQNEVKGCKLGRKKSKYHYLQLVS